MKSTIPFLTGTVGLLATSNCASALVASTTAVIQDISAQFAAFPEHAGLQTWAVDVLYEHASDVMLSHSSANIQALTGTFFNLNPVTDDPAGIIPDATGGLTPLGLIIGPPPYIQWLWDSNLSVGGSAASQPQPGSTQSSTLITGGAFVSPPVMVQAGSDLLIDVAQITMAAGGTFSGHTTVYTLNPAGGSPIATQIQIGIIPGPGALAVLGVWSLVCGRARRPGSGAML